MAGMTAQKVARYRLIPSGEMARLFAALGQESLYAQTFFLFCIVCGYSAASVATLEWTDVEPGEEPREAERSETTAIAPTADRREMTISVLSPILLRRLDQLPRRGPFIFYSHRENGSFWSPQTARLNWGRVCRRARLPTIKLRDVRYTWAQWTSQQDVQCRQLEAVIDRATVRMYQSMQPPTPMKTTRVVPVTRRMEMRRTLQPLQKTRPPLTTDWPG